MLLFFFSSVIESEIFSRVVFGSGDLDRGAVGALFKEVNGGCVMMWQVVETKACHVVDKSDLWVDDLWIPYHYYNNVLDGSESA